MMLPRIPAGAFLLALGLLVSPAPLTSPAFAAGATLDAPSTVDVGQPMTIGVQGDGAYGVLEVRGPDRGDGYAGMAPMTYQVAGPQVSITAPDLPGTYLVTYVGSGGRVLAKAKFDVAGTPVTLSIPTSLGSGYEARILWRGPGREGDMLQVFDPQTGRVLTEAPAIGDRNARNTTMLLMPDARGNFQIRYWSGRAQVPLRTLEVTIDKGIGWLRSPIEKGVNQRFQVSWDGPADPNMEYRVATLEGTVLDSAPVQIEGGKALSATLKAPSRRGKYRVQIINTGTGYIIADVPLAVHDR